MEWKAQEQGSGGTEAQLEWSLSFPLSDRGSWKPRRMQTSSKAACCEQSLIAEEEVSFRVPTVPAMLTTMGMARLLGNHRHGGNGQVLNFNQILFLSVRVWSYQILQKQPCMILYLNTFSSVNAQKGFTPQISHHKFSHMKNMYLKHPMRNKQV